MDLKKDISNVRSDRYTNMDKYVLDIFTTVCLQYIDLFRLEPTASI